MTAKKDPGAAATAETEAKAAPEQESGYRGVKVDPTPDEAYSLLTGPDSPAHVPDSATRAEQHTLKEKADD